MITKATRDTTKLNFITDQGSTRAMVRWACRDERFEDALGRAPGAGDEPAAPALAGPTLTGGVRGGAEVLAFVFERRKFRAGDDGEVGTGSGTSHTKLAAETVGTTGSGDTAGGGSEPSRPVSVPNRALPSGHPVPLWIGAGSSSAGTTGSTAGAATPGEATPGEATDDEATDEDKPWSASAQSSSASGATGAATGRLRLAESRGAPMLSAGRAGTSWVTAVFSSIAELPLA